MNGGAREKYLLEKERRYLSRVSTDQNGRRSDKRAARLLEMVLSLKRQQLQGDECRATELRARRLLVGLRKRRLKACAAYLGGFNLLCLLLRLAGKESLALLLVGTPGLALVMADHVRMIVYHSKLIKSISSSPDEPTAAAQPQRIEA
jgi:hypothetical protein